MNSSHLDKLRIDAKDKVRPTRSTWGIWLVVTLITGVALYFAWPREGDDRRVKGGSQSASASTAKPVAEKKPSTASSPTPAVTATATTRSVDNTQETRTAANTPLASLSSEDIVLTTSGYIINRERIELSPRFMGVVKWIGVKKGDAVTNGQVVVLLDDAEYRARIAETEGRMESARTAIARAELNYQRVKSLTQISVESKEREDEARLNLDAARASLKEIEGQLQLMRTYLDWCVIRSPINGVVLEKLVDPNELVTPQSFGGTRGPSTALISLADPKDLQVEIDLNEADVAKVFLNQKCRVSPEAYPDKIYEGYVAEMSPEANRQKGTLMIKVQIRNPDQFLTPELSAKVDFTKETTKPGKS